MNLRIPGRLRPRDIVTVALLASIALPEIQASAQTTPWGVRDDSDLETATQLYKTSRYEEAAKLLAELARKHPEMAGLQRKLGVCYYYMRRPDEALSHLRQYLVLQQGHITVEDREDVQRWIDEMEALRAQPQAAPKTMPTSDAMEPLPRTQNALPQFRRGFLLLPYVGLQFPVHAIGWIASGVRFGTLLGGHLSKNLSLAGEPAISLWSFSFCQDQTYCIDVHRAVQLDASAALLRHVAWPRTELVFGPKAGWAVVLRHNPREITYPYVNGPQLGARMGLFLVVTHFLAVGVVVDLSYIRAYSKSKNRCFSAEPDCNDAVNTVLGSLTLAVLL